MRSIIWLVTILCVYQTGFSFCEEQPIVSIDTLKNGNLESSFEFKEYESFINFIDTIPKDFLVQWLLELHENSKYSFRGRVSSALYKMDTLVSDIDTTVGCTDVIYEITEGQEYGLVEFKTNIGILEVYKGDLNQEEIQIVQNEIYPFECEGNFGYDQNPYTLLVEKEFLFFNDVLTEFPITGPSPHYICAVENGFFIDSLGNVTKVGRLRSGYSKGNSGAPGFSVTLDSLTWYFDNVLRTFENKHSVNTSFSKYLNGGKRLIFKNTGRSYLIDGRVISIESD